MAQKLDERRREITSHFLNILHAPLGREDNIQSSTARSIAYRICQVGSLDDFLKFVDGSVFGWEDESKNEQAQLEAATREDGFHGPFKELDPDYVGTHYGSEAECSFDERRGTYSPLSDDGTEVATATTMGTSDQDRLLDSQIPTLRDDALDDFDMGPPISELLPGQSSATAISAQTNGTVQAASLNTTHENITEAQITQPTISDTRAVEHEPAHENTSVGRSAGESGSGSARNHESSKSPRVAKRLRSENSCSDNSRSESHERIHGKIRRQATEKDSEARAFQFLPLSSNKRLLYTESDGDDSCDDAKHKGKHPKRRRKRAQSALT